MTSCNIEDSLDTEGRRLLSTDKQFAKMSLEKGAAEAFKHFLTEDALGLPDGQAPVFGRESLYAGMKQNQENYMLSWEPQRAEVASSEDMGWTWGTYVLTTTDDDGIKQEHHGKYLNIWKRQDDGQWKVAVDMGNSNQPPSE